MVESGMEMEGEGNKGGKEVQIFGIRNNNNGEWGTGSAGGREGEKRNSNNERVVGYKKEEIR